MENKKILFIKTHAIGDIIHSTIAAYAVKLKHPNWELHYLTQMGNDEILKNCPYVDKIICYKKDSKNDLVNLFNTIKELKKQNYDHLISFNYTLKNYLVSFLSNAKKITFKKNYKKNWVENYFYTTKSAIKDIELPERLYLKNCNTEAKNKIDCFLKDFPRPYIVFNPGEYLKQKRQGRVWSIEKWKKLSQEILKKYNGTIFINGSNQEKNEHEKLKNENVIITSGMFNIQECCALLSEANLVISGDSGPIHLASAYNVNTLEILGSTSPDKIKPYGKKGFYIEPNYECKYCWKKICNKLKQGELCAPCIESITVDMVLNKIESDNLIKKY